MKATKVNAGLADSNGRLLLGIWRDSLHVSCGLTACTPGSAPGPTLGNEYGKTLPLPFLIRTQQGCRFKKNYFRFLKTSKCSLVFRFLFLLCNSINKRHTHFNCICQIHQFHRHVYMVNFSFAHWRFVFRKIRRLDRPFAFGSYFRVFGLRTKKPFKNLNLITFLNLGFYQPWNTATYCLLYFCIY